MSQIFSLKTRIMTKVTFIQLYPALLCQNSGEMSQEISPFLVS